MIKASRTEQKGDPGAESVFTPSSHHKQVGQLLYWRMSYLSVRTASAAKRAEHCSDALGWRSELWRRPCPPPSILLHSRWHQLANENPFQAPITNAFPQPSPAWEPDQKKTKKSIVFMIKHTNLMIVFCFTCTPTMWLNIFNATSEVPIKLCFVLSRQLLHQEFSDFHKYLYQRLQSVIAFLHTQLHFCMSQSAAAINQQSEEDFLPVGVSGDLIVHHHRVYQTLGQQASGFLHPQLQGAQSPQVLTLRSRNQSEGSLFKQHNNISVCF